jgi:hypothetical protein
MRAVKFARLWIIGSGDKVYSCHFVSTPSGLCGSAGEYVRNWKY